MGQIILYSSSDCIRCRLVKQMLNVHNVQYAEIIDNKQLMIDKGFDEVPAIEVDGKTIDGYSRVLSWIKKNGWYSFEEANDND